MIKWENQDIGRRVRYPQVNEIEIRTRLQSSEIFLLAALEPPREPRDAGSKFKRTRFIGKTHLYSELEDFLPSLSGVSFHYFEIVFVSAFRFLDIKIFAILSKPHDDETVTATPCPQNQRSF